LINISSRIGCTYDIVYADWPGVPADEYTICIREVAE